MKVYVVAHGEQGEGDTLDSIHACEFCAIIRAKDVVERDYGFNEMHVNEAGTSWTNGCDTVYVHPYDIDECTKGDPHVDLSK